ncbi:hypothetical protein B296_00029135 [Ensete ventricosum]|uniref:Uncharacterized protein n=1 Tax=Ensete ventricosum TaxID=4639 RepID=A0A426XGV3_ENSVE|nr:hypothetical protein B296_00029135 [Ensete ventricosum]
MLAHSLEQKGKQNWKNLREFLNAFLKSIKHMVILQKELLMFARRQLRKRTNTGWAFNVNKRTATPVLYSYPDYPFARTILESGSSNERSV